jgi:hypothetical protein
MKIAWIAAAERYLPKAGLRAVGSLLGFLDGARNWHPISTAPFKRDVALRISGEDGPRVVPFRCRQIETGWINSDLGMRVQIEPIEWRAWPDSA